MIYKRIAGLRFYPKSSMLYINGFVSASSTKKWKDFLKFQFFFELLAENRKIFKQIAMWEY